MKSCTLLTVVALAALAFGWVGQTRADQVYVLDSGATITPILNGQPAGPAEPLTGEFVWHPIPFFDPSYGQAFSQLGLYFSSPSYTLTLDPLHWSDYGSNAVSTGVTYFDAVVDISGQPPIPYLLGSGGVPEPSSYTGDFHDPTTVSYNNLEASAEGGGAFVVSLNFTATAVVPEPVSGSLVIVAGASLLRRKRGLTAWK